MSTSLIAIVIATFRNVRFQWAVVVAAISVAVGVVGHTAQLLPRLEQDTVHARYSIRGPDPAKGIVVVGIDDKSLSSLKQNWPFQRSVHAQAIDRLSAAGARLIVYDVEFTETTRNKQDWALSRAIERAGGVILATTEIDNHGRTSVLGGDRNLRKIGAVAAAGALVDGHGGVTERVPFEISHLKSLAVAATERLTGRQVPRRNFPPEGALIDYRGGAGVFPEISFSDIVQGKFDPGAVAGKVVVVGATSNTLRDLHSTPTTGLDVMSGPEIQANAIWTVLNGVPLRDAPQWLEYLLIALLGVLIPLAHARYPTLASISVPLLAMSVSLAIYLAFRAGILIECTWPLLTLALATIGSIAVSHVVLSRERARVALLNDELENRVQQRTTELAEAQMETIMRLALAAETRDSNTGRHLERISRMASRLGRAAGLSMEDVEVLRYASLLHDVGKIAVEDSILLKPGKLTKEERAAVELHTVAGGDMLADSSSPILRWAEVIARTHHERWDGTGYPAGLKGAHIPLAGRIVAVVDVYDALRSARPYKPGWPVEKVIDTLWKERGKHFDPDLIDRFLHLIPEMEDDIADLTEPETPLCADVAAEPAPAPRQMRTVGRSKPPPRIRA
jgi:CHASE2 domain-containing sensor protein